MSYVLAFWKQSPRPLEPEPIYLRLNDLQHVDEVEDLPVQHIVERLLGVFVESTVTPPSPEWPYHVFDWEGPSGALQGTLTRQSLIVSAHGFPQEDMNRLIDLMSEFDARRYDPQVDERFDGPVVEENDSGA